MAHPSKRKGNRFERELVEAFAEAGLEAVRAYGSNGEALVTRSGVRCETTVDVLVQGGKGTSEAQEARGNLSAASRRCARYSSTRGPWRDAGGGASGAILEAPSLRLHVGLTARANMLT